jgi:hypothetical protein
MAALQGSSVWQHRALTDHVLRVCLDNPNDDITHLWLAITNHAHNGESGGVKQYSYSTLNHCPSALTGTINYTITNTSNTCSDPTTETGCSYQQTITGSVHVNLVPSPSAGEAQWIDHGGSWSSGVTGSSTVTELPNNPPTPVDGCNTVSHWSGAGTDDTSQANVNYDATAGTVSNMSFLGTNQDTGTWTTNSTTTNCHDPTLDGSDSSTTTDFLWSGDLDAYGCQDSWPVKMVNGQPTTVTINCTTSLPSYNNTTQDFTATGTLTFSGT